MLWNHKIVSKVYNVIGNGNSELEIGIRQYLKTGFVCFSLAHAKMHRFCYFKMWDYAIDVGERCLLVF